MVRLWVRSAAKNHNDVVVIVDPSQYDTVIEEMESNGNSTSERLRKTFAIEAFTHTARYDSAISNWFSKYNSENNFSP